MSATTEKRKYDPVAMTIHWLMGFMLFVPLYFTWTLDQEPLEEQAFVMIVHSTNGTAIFLLAAFRLWWRRRNPPPQYPATMPQWQQKLATGNVHLLYTMMLAQPVIGFLHALTQSKWPVNLFGFLNIAQLPNETITSVFYRLHELGAIILIACLAVHIAAALYHALIQRDTVLQRMIPFTRP